MGNNNTKVTTFDLKESLTISNLTIDSVLIKVQEYLIKHDKVINIGIPSIVSYINSEEGRKQLSIEIEEPYLSCILKIWEDTPTIEYETKKEKGE